MLHPPGYFPTLLFAAEADNFWQMIFLLAYTVPEGSSGGILQNTEPTEPPIVAGYPTEHRPFPLCASAGLHPV